MATAQEIDGQFVVFAGSMARKKGVPSWQSYKSLREKLVADGSLVDSDDPACLVFAENVAFNSPSAAASAVMARASNGRANWAVKSTGSPTATGRMPRSPRSCSQGGPSWMRTLRSHEPSDMATAASGICCAGSGMTARS